MPKPFLIKSQSWISALLLQHKESRMRRARQTSRWYCLQLCSYFPSPSPASPGETHRKTLWQHVFSLRKCIASDGSLCGKKVHTRPVTSLKLNVPALKNNNGECWSSAGECSFSLMCLSGAVVEQNSKSIKQLVHPIPWLSPGKIYWLRQQLGHTETSSFLHGWLDIESHTGPWAWCCHRAQACHLSGAGIAKSVPILHIREDWPFPYVSLPTLQLWKLCCEMAAHC